MLPPIVVDEPPLFSDSKRPPLYGDVQHRIYHRMDPVQYVVVAVDSYAVVAWEGLGIGFDAVALMHIRVELVLERKYWDRSIAIQNRNCCVETGG